MGLEVRAFVGGERSAPDGHVVDDARQMAHGFMRIAAGPVTASGCCCARLVRPSFRYASRMRTSIRSGQPPHPYFVTDAPSGD